MQLPYESRDKSYLEPELRKRMEISFLEYEKRWPNEPPPFIVETYRSHQKQEDLYAQGRTRPGNIVTHVRAGGSFHNYYPTLAFDIAFNIPASAGGPWSRLELFEKFAVIAKELDIEWGGDWKYFVDRPHFQVPRYSIPKAWGEEPVQWNSLPKWAESYVKQENRTDFRVEVPFDRAYIVTQANEIKELDLEVVNIVNAKLYLKVRNTIAIE